MAKIKIVGWVRDGFEHFLQFPMRWIPLSLVLTFLSLIDKEVYSHLPEISDTLCGVKANYLIPMWYLAANAIGLPFLANFILLQKNLNLANQNFLLGFQKTFFYVFFYIILIATSFLLFFVFLTNNLLSSIPNNYQEAKNLVFLLEIFVTLFQSVFSIFTFFAIGFVAINRLSALSAIKKSTAAVARNIVSFFILIIALTILSTLVVLFKPLLIKFLNNDLLPTLIFQRLSHFLGIEKWLFSLYHFFLNVIREGFFWCVLYSAFNDLSTSTDTSKN